ncbi:hypothetical protein M8C21_026207 [Ambrosia artemisiifolia]|uniref:Spen paralogue and orthologue SPOC C-terminal domain-containing protein n=1 Tax=Ambrosia artemisiifolia TaxID=4212 RepID=A0AAD5GQJ2_AMBAR|nr:hypothetical protein M8C21_026207 [Ambrosia artemisiifolia]
MLKEKWEDKHGINLPAHTSCSNNMVRQPVQGLSGNDHLTGSSSKINVATLTSSGSNLQDGIFAFPINQPTSVEPAGFKQQFNNQQSHFPETQAGQTLVDSNLQQLIKYLSANYGPSKTPLEVGTPEYLKLVEILKQSSANGGGSSVEKLSGGLKDIGPPYSKDGGINNIQNVETASLTGNQSSTGRNDQEKISSSEKAAEQLWEGTLQLSSSVTLSAVAFFKSGEKLVGNNWPEFIEVKGKVRLEAFEKYVQDLPRSRNRGLMVTSICWNEGSSNIGLNGMKEVAKGYKKSSRVGFAHLLSGIDLYICPRSDPIITILAKYGFFKGMSVLDDKPDSMIGCVVWRKNRPLNPVGNTSDGKSSSPSLTQPQDSPPGFSSKQGSEKKLSPEKTESSQRDEPLSLPLTIAYAEVGHNKGSSSSSAEVDSCSNLVVKKRPFEDDDLPEFDFGVTCGKSTLVSKPLNSPKKLDNSPLIQLPAVVNAIERNNSNDGLLKPSLKKTKLFDDDDMPEWRPPELHNQLPPQSTISNFQNLPVHPPRLPPPPPPTLPPPPRPDARPYSYLPFQPPISSQPPVYVRPPPPPPLQLPPPPRSQPPSRPSGMFNSHQVLWHQPPFPTSNGRRPQL